MSVPSEDENYLLMLLGAGVAIYGVALVVEKIATEIGVGDPGLVVLVLVFFIISLVQDRFETGDAS